MFAQKTIHVQPGEYNWTIHVRRWCSLMSNYFDHCLIRHQSYHCIENVYWCTEQSVMNQSSSGRIINYDACKLNKRQNMIRHHRPIHQCICWETILFHCCRQTNQLNWTENKLDLAAADAAACWSEAELALVPLPRQLASRHLAVPSTQLCSPLHCQLTNIAQCLPSVLWHCLLGDRKGLIKILHPTWHKIGHSTDALPSQSLD